MKRPLSESSSTGAMKLKAKVISDQFWPRFREERFGLPPTVQSAMEAYRRRYQVFKANRTLEWKASLGSVDLSLRLDGGRVVSLTVSPLHAVIIHAFQRKGAHLPSHGESIVV